MRLSRVLLATFATVCIVGLLVAVPSLMLVGASGVSSLDDDSWSWTVPTFVAHESSESAAELVLLEPFEIVVKRVPAMQQDLDWSMDLEPGSLPGPPPLPARPPRPAPVEEPVSASIESAEPVTPSPPPAWTSDRVLVRLVSDPLGAEIRVDGRFRGRTPAKLMLNPGRYALRLQLDRARTKLTFDADADTKLCFAPMKRRLVQVDCA